MIPLVRQVKHVDGIPAGKNTDPNKLFSVVLKFGQKIRNGETP